MSIAAPWAATNVSTSAVLSAGSMSMRQVSLRSSSTPVLRGLSGAQALCQSDSYRSSSLACFDTDGQSTSL